MVKIKKKLLFLLIPWALFFVSCRGEQLLFYSDPYWEKVFFTSKEIKKAAPPGVSVLPVVPSAEAAKDPQKAAETMGTFDGTAVILTPFYSDSAAEFAKEFPEKDFFLLSFHEKENKKDKINVPYRQVFLTRHTAFAEAGREVCGYLLHNPETKTAGVWAIGAPERKKEYQAFFTGFSEKCAPERFSVRLVDENKKQEEDEERFLETFIEETDFNSGPVFGFALIPGYNHRLVTHFFDFSIPFFTEYVDNEEYDSVNSLFSVEYPLEKVLASVVEAAKKGKKTVKVEAVFTKRE